MSGHGGDGGRGHGSETGAAQGVCLNNKAGGAYNVTVGAAVDISHHSIQTEATLTINAVSFQARADSTNAGTINVAGSGAQLATEDGTASAAVRGSVRLRVATVDDRHLPAQPGPPRPLTRFSVRPRSVEWTRIDSRVGGCRSRLGAESADGAAQMTRIGAGHP